MGSGPGACPGLFMKIIMQGGGYVLCVGGGFGCFFLLLPVACSFLPSVLKFLPGGMIMRLPASTMILRQGYSLQRGDSH